MKSCVSTRKAQQRTTLSRPHRAATWALLLAGSNVLGCRNVDEDEVSGELGAGKFRYVCVSSSDPVCPSGGRAAVFPDRIGVDGVFDVEFEKFRGSSDPSDFTIGSVAPSIVAEDLSFLRAVSPGTVALLARNRSDGNIVDLIHVHTAAIEALRLERLGSSLAAAGGDTLQRTLEVGESERLRVVPVDADGVTVAGSRDFNWSSTDERVADLVGASPSATMTIAARGAGTATITVTTRQVTTTLEILVEPTPGGTDAGIDARAPADARAPSDSSTSNDASVSNDSGNGAEAGGSRDGELIPDSGAREAGSEASPDAAPTPGDAAVDAREDGP